MDYNRHIQRIIAAKRRGQQKLELAFLGSADSLSDLSIYNLGTKTLGAPHSRRYIGLAVVFTENSSGGDTTDKLTNVSINGVLATVLNIASHLSKDGGRRSAFANCIAHVPDDEEGNITVTFSETMLECAIGWYRILNYRGVEIDNTATDGSESGTNHATAILSGFNEPATAAFGCASKNNTGNNHSIDNDSVGGAITVDATKHNWGDNNHSYSFFHIEKGIVGDPQRARILSVNAARQGIGIVVLKSEKSP